MLSRFSCVQLFATPWTVARQAPLSMRFSSQESWNGWPLPPPGDLLDPEIEPSSLTTLALAGGFFTTCAISFSPLRKQWEPWFAEEQTERWNNSIKGQAGWRRRPESTPECVSSAQSPSLPEAPWLWVWAASLSTLLNWLLGSCSSYFSPFLVNAFTTKFSLIDALSKFCVLIYGVLFSIISE